MAKTKRDRIEAYLLGRGYKHEWGRDTSKYMCWVKDLQIGHDMLWLGRSGGVRRGNTVTSSMSVTPQTWAEVQLWEAQQR